MRQLQFTNEKGEKKIFEHEEALKIVGRIVQTEMVKEAFVAGIPIVADGGEYKLLGSYFGL